MKKNKIIILFILSVLFIPNLVNAKRNADSDFILNDQVLVGNYMPVCSYDYNVPMSYTDDIKTTRINIYYIYKGNKWLVAWDDTNLYSDNYYEKSGAFSDVFSKKGKNIYINDDIKNNLKKGVCPDNAWLVKAGNTIRVCFGSQSSCSNISDIGASSTKKYDIMESITNYFENSAPTFNSCEELRNKNFDISSKIEEDFKTNFLNVDYTPSIVLESDAYTKGLKSLKQKYQQYKKQCDSEVNKDTTLTVEEKKELREQNQEGLDTAISQVEHFDEQISAQLKDFTDSIKSGPLSCDEITSGSFGSFLNMILSLIRFAVPIIILGLSIKDYIMAITSQDAGAIKKASASLVKRLAIGVIIFVLPTLLDFLLKLAGVECGVSGL